MNDSTDQTVDDDGYDGTIEVLPPARPADMVAVATLREHVGAMRDAKLFAEAMCYTALVPERFRGKPGDGAAAILFGAELGLSPIASLRSIIVIHGQPGLEARTMKALLKVKGYRFTTHEDTEDACDMEAWSPDGLESERCRFTMDDAIKAQYVPVETKPGVYKQNANGKLLGNMKYLTEPRNMLRAKATAVVCREIAPHILLGMPYASEELTSQDWDTDDGGPPVKRRRGGKGVDGLAERAERAAAGTMTRKQQQVIEGTGEDPGRGGGNDASQGAKPSSGSALTSDSPDQEPSKSGMRKALEKRLFALINDIQPTINRDDRILIYRAILNRDDITSTDDLDDEAVDSVSGQLYEWGKAGKLDTELTDIFNAATLAEEQAAQEEPQS